LRPLISYAVSDLHEVSPFQSVGSSRFKSTPPPRIGV
jgi:hypothetical protein